MDRMKDRVALVTGGARGIGRGIAERLVEEGARVVITDRDNTAGRATAAALGAAFIRQDVADEQGWRDIVSHLDQEFGGLHALVNNAGTDGDVAQAKDPEHAELDDWNNILSVNTTSVFLASKHCIPLLAKSGGGSIVNLSSVSSLVPVPILTAYATSKAAVDHLTRITALHCATAGYRIRCNTIHPGEVRTALLTGLFDRVSKQTGMGLAEVEAAMLSRMPMGEFQEPRDIANAALFLLSDEARHITGQALAIDGGFTLAN